MILFSQTPEEIYSKMSDMNMIDKFVFIVKEYCDAPETFIRAGGYSLISSLQGRFATVVGVPFSGRPNPWFIISSIPARMRRSATLNYVEYVYKGILKQYYKGSVRLTKSEIEEIEKEIEKEFVEEDKSLYISTLEDEDKKKLAQEGVDKRNIQSKSELSTQKQNWTLQNKINDMVDSSIIEEGSKEGLMDHLGAAYKKGLTELIILSPEFGAIISSIMQKSYQFGVASLLSKLKYGESGTVYLSQRGGKKGLRYVPPGLFITMFATMQEPGQYLTEAQSRQGLLRRLMIGYIKNTDLDMKDWKAPIRNDRWKLWELLDLYTKELYTNVVITDNSRSYAEKLGDIECVPIYIDDVKDELNDLARKIDEEIIHDDSDYLIYKQGTWEQLTELAAIHCIARRKFEGDISTEIPSLMFNVTKEDLDIVKEFHEKFSMNAEEVLDNINRPASKFTSHEKDLDRIYRYVYRAGIEGIKKTDLGNSAKLLKDALNEILDTLVSYGRVKMKTIPTKGRQITVYISTELLERKDMIEKEKIEHNRLINKGELFTKKEGK